MYSAAGKMWLSFSLGFFVLAAMLMADEPSAVAARLDAANAKAGVGLVSGLEGRSAAEILDRLPAAEAQVAKMAGFAATLERQVTAMEGMAKDFRVKAQENAGKPKMSGFYRRKAAELDAKIDNMSVTLEDLNDELEESQKRLRAIKEIPEIKEILAADALSREVEEKVRKLNEIKIPEL